LHHWEIAQLQAGVGALIIVGKRLVAIPAERPELEVRVAVASWLYHSRLARTLVCLEGEVNNPVQCQLLVIAHIPQPCYNPCTFWGARTLRPAGQVSPGSRTGARGLVAYGSLLCRKT